MDFDIIKKAAELYSEFGNKSKVAEELGVSRRTVGRYLEKAALTGNDGLSLKSVPYGHNVKGVSTLYDENGNVRAQWVKTRVDGPDVEQLAEYFTEAFKDIEYYSDFQKSPDVVNDYKMTVYPLADLHFGMQAWGEECGDDYDLKIAKQTAIETFAKLVEKSEPTNECLIVNLGDAIHINDSKNMTPASGHILDVDSRYQKIIYTAVEAFVNIIDIALSKHKRVVFRNVAGNHDPDATVALNIALKMFSKDDDRIVIDDSPRQLKAYKYGVNLIGFYHGHTMKEERAAMALAAEYGEWWGLTKFRHLMHGHFHSKQNKEFGGVDVEGFNTIATRDAYSASGGYVSKRRLTSITYDYKKGEDSRSFVNLI